MVTLTNINSDSCLDRMKAASRRWELWWRGRWWMSVEGFGVVSFREVFGLSMVNMLSEMEIGSAVDAAPEGDEERRCFGCRDEELLLSWRQW